MEETGIPCLVCDGTITAGQTAYCYTTCTEQKRDGAYDVRGAAECHFSACMKCLDKQGMEDQLIAAEDELIQKFRSEHESKSKKITAIRNQYDCCVCDQPIPDGSKIFTATHSHDIFNRDRGLSCNAKHNLLACYECAEQHKIKERLDQALDEFIPKWKRATLKLV